uniref:Uncharacterized protein n=1 Tax=Alexandrium monilatum TaxID=311494 RepID=A0A7S4QDJ1_9DINO
MSPRVCSQRLACLHIRMSACQGVVNRQLPNSVMNTLAFQNPFPVQGVHRKVSLPLSLSPFSLVQISHCSGKQFPAMAAAGRAVFALLLVLAAQVPALAGEPASGAKTRLRHVHGWLPVAAEWEPGMAQDCDCVAVLGKGTFTQRLWLRLSGHERAPATPSCLKWCSRRPHDEAAEATNGPIRTDL